MTTRAVSVSSCGVLIAAASMGACFPEDRCDTAPYKRCAAGVIYEGGCGGPDRAVAQCAQGCSAEDAYGSYGTCPFVLCRENVPKKQGDACQAAADCVPTTARVSTFEVANTYLACDAATQACVATDPPVVTDWLAPCDAALIAGVAAQGEGQWLDAAIPDPSCAEGWCAVYRPATTGCIANACTRACAGDQDCPSGATCQNAEPAGCDFQTRPAYCKPGGPAGNGFTCR